MSLPAYELRRFVYDQIVATGTPPRSEEIGAHFGVNAATARASLAELRIGKSLLVHPAPDGEIWMMGPFASAPTAYRVLGHGRTWFANCAWDMLGIPALLGEPVDIAAECADSGRPMRMHVDPEAGPESEAEWVVHFLVPARRWYDDIGFT